MSNNFQPSNDDRDPDNLVSTLETYTNAIKEALIEHEDTINLHGNYEFKNSTEPHMKSSTALGLVLDCRNILTAMLSNDNHTDCNHTEDEIIKSSQSDMACSSYYSDDLENLIHFYSAPCQDSDAISTGEGYKNNFIETINNEENNYGDSFTYDYSSFTPCHSRVETSFAGECSNQCNDFSSDYLEWQPEVTKPEKGALITSTWKQYQAHSIEQHCLRLQSARESKAHREQVERIKRTAILTKHKSKKYVCKNNLELTSDILRDNTQSSNSDNYLLKYCTKNQGPKKAAEQNSSPTTPILCGVNLHANRRFRPKCFITTTSIEDLYQQVQDRFQISVITNIYRCKRSIYQNTPKDCSKIKSKFKSTSRMPGSWERINDFEQLLSGDTVCVTQSTREDMSMLCDWLQLKQRQQEVLKKTVESETSKENAIISDTKTKYGRFRPQQDVSANKSTIWDNDGRVLGISPKF